MQNIKMPLNTLRKDRSDRPTRVSFLIATTFPWKKKCQVTIWNQQTKISCYICLQQKHEIWLAVYSRSNLICVTYISHLSIDPSITYPMCWLRGIFFYQKITQCKKNNSKMTFISSHKALVYCNKTTVHYASWEWLM